jgi:hypothetical protein
LSDNQFLPKSAGDAIVLPLVATTIVGAGANPEMMQFPPLPLPLISADCLLRKTKQ